MFDVGGVLLDWDPRYLYRKLFANEAEMEWFLSEVCLPAWHALHDRGVLGDGSRPRHRAPSSPSGIPSSPS